VKNSLIHALPFAQAFEKLLHPFAEVVVHDLESDQIAAIFNPLSRRVVGDPSYLERMELETTETLIGPYEKTNWDGRRMKSISVVLKDATGKPEGFLCVNVDVSNFDKANQMLNLFLGNQPPLSEQSEQLFKDDMYEKLNVFVQDYCRDHQVAMEALSREDKKAIVAALAQEGAFNSKNAANYIGRVLGISRATVYNYLKENES